MIALCICVPFCGLIAPPAGASQPTTSPQSLEDTIDAFTTAAKQNNAAAMASFYYVENASDNRLATANANRVLSAAAFSEAGKKYLPSNDPQGHGLGFALSNQDLDFPKMYDIHENGDEAALTLGGPDQKSEWFKRIKGMWKLDITPAPPLTIADAAQDMEEDSVSINRVTNSIVHAKVKTWREVRDALGEAMLNADIVPDQLMDEMPPQHERLDPHGKFPTDPATPAGAMNRFVQALQKSDEATVSDSLYMPTDKTGEYRSAAAHDWVTGMHLLLAAESKFPKQEDSDRICYWLGGVTRDEVRGYTDDEWKPAADRADVAGGSSAEIPKTQMRDGQSFTVMVWGSVPLMHHCPDGHWRLGPRFARNDRKLQQGIELFEAKDKILNQAAIEIRNGKFTTDAQAINAVMPQLGKLGPSWNLAK